MRNIYNNNKHATLTGI